MTTDNVYRLPVPFGNRIDRTQPLNFTFDGNPYQGYPGDTLASALYANGVRLISRSFKYHRPRGAWSFAGLDANAYVQVGDQPSVAADQLALYDGLEAKAQNVWGSLANDKGSYTGLLARFLPVGFYYHAFFRPKGVWRYWERLFRRTAGLGKISRDTPPGYFDKQYLFADVAVIGAGPAGMEAALSAAEQGADVILIDDGPVLGGSLNYARFGRSPDEISSLREELSRRVIESNRIRVLTNTTCSGWFGDNWLSLDSILENRSRLYKLRAREVIACTGSVEQPIVFRNNDLPGILPASGAQRLIRQYGVRPGNQATIVTANREGYDLCRDLLDCGVGISAVIDLNEHPADPQTCDWLKKQGIGMLTAHAVTEAVPGPGNRSITGVIVKPLPDGSIHEGDGKLFSCDTLITSAGYSPLAQLLCHSGGRMIYDRDVHSFRLDASPPHAHLAGSINHRYDLDAVLRDGQAVGLAAGLAAGMAVAVAAGHGADSDQAINAGSRELSNEQVNHPYPIFAHPDGKDFVDFDEDITVSDLENAVADGFEHPELAKRYSTTAMGPSQGRLSALNAMRIVLQARGHGSEDSGNPEVTTQRPPFKPVSFGVLAGRSFQPERLTPMHNWHLEHGATMMPAGLWQRPAFYGLAENRDKQVIDEVAVVRNNAGLIDVSTLGGIEVRGSDAAAFLNRMYTFAYAKQEIGRTRYLLMTDESGSIIDDGVACRLAEDYFYVTTTTTGSDNVYRGMLKSIAEWRMEVDLVNVTSAYAAMNIVGPNSREVIQALIQKAGSDIDFSRSAFPYLAARTGHLAGVPVLAMRVGFVGEPGYELHVPWSQALSFWKQLMEAGKSSGIRPFGVEAQRILRLEKGHIIVGQDTDGLTFPAEAGLGWAVSQKKGDFIGRAAINILNRHEVSRKLTGFRLIDPDGPMPEECHLVLKGSEIAGRVTSIARSEALNSVIGLAYVAPDQAIPGQQFEIKTANGRMVTAESVDLPFYDPENERQQM